MKERPIIFSAPMVRAILAGTKTQTRRALKQVQVRSAAMPEPEWRSVHTLCPYGQPGDRLWVRETWACNPYDDKLWYRATDQLPDSAEYGPLKWLPSIFMPRIASRITLEITEVRVERLQEISEADAKAEGIIAHRKGGWHVEQPPAGTEGTNHFGFKTARGFCAALWEGINGRGSWNANPWVWCLTFRRIEP